MAITEPDPVVISSPSPTPTSTRIPAPDGGRSAATRPGVAAEACSGPSAARYTSMACPRAGTGLGDSWPPRAISSCSLARSSPVVSSVIRYPDGGWTLKSMNMNCRVAGSIPNSADPVPRKPAAEHSRMAASRNACSLASLSRTQADSTMTGRFRCRMLPSRTPTAHIVPWPSATTWTSTWRAAGPGSALGPAGHGPTGTPTLSASCLVRALSPSRRMTSLPGPTNVMPSRSHNRASSAGSAINSQLAQRASARAWCSAASSRTGSRRVP